MTEASDLSTRRWVARLVRIALVVLAIAMVGVWIARRAPEPRRIQVQSEAPDSLGQGDVRIFNRDSSVQVLLVGDRVLAGLSPMSVQRVRDEIQSSSGDDQTGLGGRIARTVKQTVADNIGMHVVYPVRDIRDVRYVNGRIVIDQNRSASTLFRNVKIDGSREASSFREEEARRFIEAVRARQRELQP